MLPNLNVPHNRVVCICLRTCYNFASTCAKYSTCYLPGLRPLLVGSDLHERRQVGFWSKLITCSTHPSRSIPVLVTAPQISRPANVSRHRAFKTCSIPSSRLRGGVKPPVRVTPQENQHGQMARDVYQQVMHASSAEDERSVAMGPSLADSVSGISTQK